MVKLIICILLIILILSHKDSKKNQKSGFVYFIQDPDTKQIKIGVAKDVSRRLKQLNTGDAGNNLKVLKTIKSKNPYKLEKEYHRKFAKYRTNPKGEWFDGKIKKWI